LYVSERRIDDAVVEFTILTQKQPNPVAAYTMLGMLLKAQNKLGPAQEKYQRALDLNPDAAVAANNLAWMYVETGGNLDVAMGLAKKAKAQLPDRADISDTLGWIYYKKGLYALAVPTLLESTGKDPQNPLYHYHLGAAYVAVGEKTKARQAFEAALGGGRRFSNSDDARRALEKLKG
jgi:tetratricopeptide (TPR) repeat protein